VHLVPFGEYLPFQRVLERVGLRNLTKQIGGFQSGDRRRAMDVPRAPKMLALICYEAIFQGAAVPRGDQRPGWLVNVTKRWLVRHQTGPYQHFQQSRVLAIAEGLPMVRGRQHRNFRCDDPLGRIVNSLPLGAEGHFDSRLPAPVAPTFFVIVGDYALILSLVVSFHCHWSAPPAPLDCAIKTGGQLKLLYAPIKNYDLCATTWVVAAHESY